MEEYELSKKREVEIIMVGRCPKCGEEHKRKYPIDAAACTCTIPESDATLVELKPVVNLSNRQYKRYEKIAKAANVSVVALVNGLLMEAAKQKLKDLKPLPTLVVTITRCGGE
jgi:hypothetical protein